MLVPQLTVARSLSCPWLHKICEWIGPTYSSNFFWHKHTARERYGIFSFDWRKIGLEFKPTWSSYFCFQIFVTFPAGGLLRISNFVIYDHVIGHLQNFLPPPPPLQLIFTMIGMVWRYCEFIILKTILIVFVIWFEGLNCILPDLLFEFFQYLFTLSSPIEDTKVKHTQIHQVSASSTCN